MGLFGDSLHFFIFFHNVISSIFEQTLTYTPSSMATLGHHFGPWPIRPLRDRQSNANFRGLGAIGVAVPGEWKHHVTWERPAMLMSGTRFGDSLWGISMEIWKGDIVGISIMEILWAYEDIVKYVRPGKYWDNNQDGFQNQENTYCKSGKPSESLSTSSLKAHLVSGRKVHGGSEKYGEVGSLLGSQLNTVGIEKKPTVHIIYPLVIKHGLLENPQ